MSGPTPDLELRTGRLVHAPPETVYRAMTEPERLERWWGRAGFTTSAQDFELRPGGHGSLTIRSPDGHQVQNQIIFDVLDPPSKIVFHLQAQAEAGPVALEVTIGLVPEGPHTRVEMLFRFATPELRSFVLNSYLAVPTNSETLNRLDAHLHSMSHPPMLTIDPGTPGFQTIRDFRAPVSRVWDALTIPEQIRRWWGGGGAQGQTEIRRFDLRPGGEWSFLEWDEHGKSLGFRGTFVEIEPRTKLVYTHGFESASQRDKEFLVTTVLQEHEGGCRLITNWTLGSNVARKYWVDLGFAAAVRVHYERLADLLSNP
jgi:uncharacterized protein YndB with AHSA1/START domain